MIGRDELRQLFDRHFPETFIKGAVQVIVRSYRDAHVLVSGAGLDECDAKWELPYKRRALIETRIRALARQHQHEGIEAAVQWVKNSGGVLYTFIAAGPFQLTVSMIEDIGELPRCASFRAEKSLFNRSLFDDENQSLRDTYYGILAHLPHPERHEPAAIRVKFPEADYKRTYDSIDLKERFGWLFEQTPVQEEKVSEPEPKLREDLGAKPGDGQEKVG